MKKAIKINTYKVLIYYIIGTYCYEYGVYRHEVRRIKIYRYHK